MKIHRFWLGSIFALILAALCACSDERSEWPGYSGTLDGYVYYCTEERDYAWEDDILFFAENFINGHPYLADKNIFIYSAAEIFDTLEVEYSNALFNEELQNGFITQVNQLIMRIPELTDAEIIYELKHIVASLGDLHSNLTAINANDKVFPLSFEHITDDEGISLYAICVPEEYADIYLGKLAAINGVSTSQIIASLSAYVSSENAQPIYQIAKPRSSNSMLSLENALQAIGVLEESANSAEFTFEVDGETVTQEIQTVSFSEYKQLTKLRHPMSTEERLLYRYDKYYWYELLDENNLYVRFSAMNQDEEQSLDLFLNQVLATIRNSGTPLRLIMDFRYNGGGSDFSDTFESFVQSLNNCTTNGVYILINGGCASAAVCIPYNLSRTIEDAVLIGSPTSQFVNCPADACAYTLPNSGYSFYVSSRYFYFAPNEEADALYPDVLLYQTWEDYINSVDTVLAYTLSVE